MTERTPACRFCYAYTPPGFIDPCCVTPVCATTSTISTMCSLPNVVNNSSRTSEQSLLLYGQQQTLVNANNANVQNAVQYTVSNQPTITSQVSGQLLQLGRERYTPYQPYIPPVVPQSVIELDMRTRNVGVPVPVMTIASCKGSQFVTT
jgi:hypothetical protein